MAIYPNPASSVLKIRGVSIDAMLEEFDQSGRIRKTGRGHSIDVSGLAAGGSYFVRITAGGKVISRQFIKQERK